MSKQHAQIGIALIGILVLAGGLTAATWAINRASQTTLLGNLLVPSTLMPSGQDKSASDCDTACASLKS